MLDRTLSLLSHQGGMVNNLSVKILASAEALSQNAAILALDYLKTCLAQQETVSMVLATGNSQLQFLEALVTSDLDWSRIILFHLDEYLGIAASHPGSFRYYLASKVEQRIKPQQFYYIQGDALQPLAECDRYTQLLQQYPIDLCLLGIGDNGHIAFNEPSVADFQDTEVVKIVKLETKTRQQQVAGGYFPNLNAVPQYAYTLTISTISQAKQIFCLASGKKKAKIIKRMLQGAIAPACPASILRKQSQATLFLDRDAASLI
ncbi:MAG TPA: glucosamine-6-phosphate deaminase [Xenococcaceae cyanobacterium]|jgi:glucosamine-6-phosphate deaminase